MNEIPSFACLVSSLVFVVVYIATLSERLVLNSQMSHMIPLLAAFWRTYIVHLMDLLVKGIFLDR